jgi:eukaryotic-like serine/threonine-protein kinase
MDPRDDSRLTGAVPEVVLSEFRVEALIGRGSHGNVYVGRAIESDELVAVKVSHSRDLERQLRFEREAKLLARIVHPNVVSVIDWGLLDDGRAVLVMEFVDGDPLDQWWSEHRETACWQTAVQIIEGVLDALSALHAANVIHRDVKPANILVLRGREPSIKLIDLGVGREEHQRDLNSITASEQVLGTIAYMAPEQLLLEPIDARVDIYGAGCVLFELLFGRSPFLGSRIQQALARCSSAGPTSIPPPVVEQTLPSELATTVLSMLRRDRAERPPSAAACAALLRAALERSIAP